MHSRPPPRRHWLPPGDAGGRARSTCASSTQCPTGDRSRVREGELVCQATEWAPAPLCGEATPDTRFWCTRKAMRTPNRLGYGAADTSRRSCWPDAAPKRVAMRPLCEARPANASGCVSQYRWMQAFQAHDFAAGHRRLRRSGRVWRHRACLTNLSRYVEGGRPACPSVPARHLLQHTTRQEQVATLPSTQHQARTCRGGGANTDRAPGSSPPSGKHSWLPVLGTNAQASFATRHGGHQERGES